MLIRRTSFLFFHREPTADRPADNPVPAAFQLERWTQRGPFDAPPGCRWTWRHLAWWCLFATRGIPLRASVIRALNSTDSAHVTFVFPSYFRFPFMDRRDLQVGAIETSREFRNLGLAKAGLDDVLAWI